VRSPLRAAAVPAAAVITLAVAELVGTAGAVLAVVAATVAGGALVATSRRRADSHQPPLEGVPTTGRDRLHRRLEALLADDHADVPLVMVAVEGVAEIDDALGHEVGDAVLGVVEGRLKAVLRGDDIVARLRGDDFAVLVSETPDEGTVARLRRRIRAAVREPCDVDGLSLLVDARITTAVIPATARSVGEALEVATITLQGARGQHPPLGGGTSPLRRLEELRRSLEADHLGVHYQPKIDLVTGRVRGAEALVRWEHPVEGMLLPEAFVPAVERTGVGRDLTLRVLEVALHQCAAWSLVGWHLELSVNVAPAALLDQRFPADVARLLGAAGVPPDLLLLELGEPLVMQDHAAVRQAAGALRGMGVRLSVDDYGTATSTLPHLRQLGISELKLDGSLVAGLGRDADTAQRVRAAVHVAHSLGVELVAEGVEDRTSWELLRDAGCDLAQGYYLSRPLPPALFGIWLRTQPAVGRLSRP
jgi:diguanylate cyclase